MARNYTKALLVSANVGSIFEDPEKMLKIWLKEFLANVKQMNPDFLAIHCQEVGGKNYEESMQHVNSFIKSLLASPEMQQFDKARVFLDEDFTAVDKFTALGSLYFIHQSVQHCQIYDFKECKFVPVKGKEVLSGNIEEVPIKEKAKFPQEFFPDFKWSRKGFIRTRWNLQNTVFDLVNLHLFHDANNIVAMESSPSVYNGNRQRTLRHTIERFENDQYAKVPYYIFGDFNFRLDTHLLVQKLGENTKQQQILGKKNDVSKVVYQDPTSEEQIMSIEKKGFHHHKHAEVFSNNNGLWLQEYDTETADFQDKLMEYDVTFPPSYPFVEDVDDGTSYMKTRCPAWCDRIMFTPDCLEMLYKDEVEYNMMGIDKCMGDHKPIYLAVKLKHGAGSSSDGSDNVLSPSSVSSSPSSLSSECMSPTDVPPESPLSSPSPSTSPASPAACIDVVLPPRHAPLKKVISINGEEVEVSSPEHIDQMNIHDFASFEKEEALGSHFKTTFRRKRQRDGAKRSSFKNMVRDVMRAESFVRALKHYSHRSDSDVSEEEDAGAVDGAGGGAQSPKSRSRGGSKKRHKLKKRHQSTEEVEDESVERSGEEKPVTFSLEDSTETDALTTNDSNGNETPREDKQVEYPSNPPSNIKTPNIETTTPPSPLDNNASKTLVDSQNNPKEPIVQTKTNQAALLVDPKTSTATTEESNQPIVQTGSKETNPVDKPTTDLNKASIPANKASIPAQSNAPIAHIKAQEAESAQTKVKEAGAAVNMNNNANTKKEVKEEGDTKCCSVQ